ncbi:WD40-repeat-containing domain protein [Massariosphaeria phaeospora]|uniref:WD40-repeat-containing domain protein n=1 Tax=Massariosphaeria phaeospora TaxID=100035 RepID=A0A7C8IHY7_9PLEO|nr:WD40-repeat-containing domain protein [Massariosphaeria phaeospora]
MAPVTMTQRKATGPQRFMPPGTEDIPLFDPQSDASDVEMQLQTETKQGASDWEGFGEADKTEERGDSSDEESVDIVIEKKKERETVAKDTEEEELERMVFGDSAGFRDGIDTFSLDPSAAEIDDLSDEEDDEEADLENIADQDLFFFDSGPVPAPGSSLAVGKKAEADKDEDKPAWEDSDDERLVFSLASVSQLRKLRETEEDDVVNGKEYVRRLRTLHSRLNGTPDWATYATGKSKKKRRRTMEDGDSTEESASDMDVDDEDDLSTQPLARLLKDADILSKASRNPAKRRKLQFGTIDIQRLKDVAKAGPSAITSLSFHPSYPLLLSSGPSSTLYLHHINSSPLNPNPLLTSLHMKRTPLTTTAFHPSPTDSRIFLSARRRYFHVWNIATGTVEKVSRIYGHQHEQRTMEHFALSPDGKYMALRGSTKKGGGIVNILDARTLQWMTQVRVESRGGIAEFVWWGDGSGLCIAGKNGEVTEWSVKDGIVGRWTDEGAVGTTVIAVGGTSGRDGWIGPDRWVAVGSSSGVVNIYDRRAWSEEAPALKETASDANNGIPKAPKPVRALDNLTTPISHLTFSPDGQMLAMASRWKHNALRLVHLPSATVFKNWPTQNTPLGRISSVAWGRPAEEDEREGSLALLAAGLETGRVRLWEVRA